MSWSAIIPNLVIALVTFVATLAATWVVIRELRRRAILDHPNIRSSHDVPTPRGGGLAVTPILLVAWTAIGLSQPYLTDETTAVTVATLLLAGLSWLDDVRKGGLSPLLRLAGQGVAVTLALLFMPGGGAMFGGLLPPPWDAVAAGLLWLWFVNLFNFMDGIDGISGVELATIGVGLTMVAMLAGLEPAWQFRGMTALGVALGFLWWNWHPARVFLGDVGSVPVGFLLGWALLSLASRGQWAPALILPLYYLADATWTILRRAARGEKIWTPHRQHFYQKAVQAGRDHAWVSLIVLATNVALLALAGLAMTGWLWEALAGAALVVAGLLAVLSRPVAGKTS